VEIPGTERESHSDHLHRDRRRDAGPCAVGAAANDLHGAEHRARVAQHGADRGEQHAPGRGGVAPAELDARDLAPRKVRDGGAYQRQDVARAAVPVRCELPHAAREREDKGVPHVGEAVGRGERGAGRK